MLKDVTWGRPRDFLRIGRSLLSRDIASLWRITAFIVHNSVFSRFLDINMSKVVTKYVEGRLMGTSSRFFKDWPITIIAWYYIPVTNNNMYCMYFCVFLRFGDINLQRTVSKYVLGRLMWTSSRLFKEWRILFCIRVTNNYLHCV